MQASQAAAKRIVRALRNAAGTVRTEGTSFARRLQRWWRDSSPFARHLVINLGIGVCLTLVLETHAIQDNVTIEAARAGVISTQMNLMLRLERGIHGAAGVHKSHLVWINIDEAAYHAWGVPLMTRRDKLRDLIAYAVRGKPRAVIVDIDVTGANATTAAYRRYDAVLRDYLGAYPRTCSKPCPTIILTRSFESSPAYAYAGYAGAAKRVVPSFLDRSIGTSPLESWRKGDPILWATVEADSESDQVIRRWRLWEAACNAPGPSAVLPSAPLLAVALLRAPPASARESVLSRVQRALEPHAATCVKQPASVQTNHVPATSFLDIGFPLELTEDSLQRLIVYNYEWAQPGTTAPLRTLDDVLDAGAIANNPSADPTYLLEGQIVVIGSSFQDGGDLHATPVGVMPGSLILINEMYSLLNDQELKPNWTLTLLAELASIVIISWLFTALTPSAATIASFVIVFALGQVLALVVFRSGIWVDCVVPLVGVMLHELIAQTHHHALHITSRIATTIKSRFS